VLTRWNAHEVEGMLTLYDELGVLFQIDPEVKPRDNGDMEPLAIEASAEGRAQYRSALRARAKRDDADTDTELPGGGPKPVVQQTDKHCGAGSNNIAIDPYGSVLPCVQWRVPVGNLHEQRIAEIWSESAGLQQVRETTKAARRMLEGLGDAAVTSNFCPGAAHVYSGDPLALYPAAEQRIAASARARVRLTVL